MTNVYLLNWIYSFDNVAFFIFCFPAALIIVFAADYVLINRIQAYWAFECKQIRVSNYIGPLPWNEGCPQPPAVPSVISGRSGGW